MDTTKHLEVALAAHDKWLHDESDLRYWPEIAVTALDSDGLLCTEVEREFIEAWAALAAPGVPCSGPELGRFDAARAALLAERAGEPVEPAPPRAGVPNDNASVGACPCVCDRAALRAEIASLKAQLAEATSRPAEGAVRNFVTTDDEVAYVHTNTLCWKVEAGAVAMFRGRNAADLAHAHAAKLDAKQGGGV